MIPLVARTLIARRHGWIWTGSRLRMTSSQLRSFRTAMEVVRGRRDGEEVVKRGRWRMSTTTANHRVENHRGREGGKEGGG
ncbi:hypothetical protein RHMOL_Rhmol08G0048500 [Rhododendron molle]|uniref:Uncharacterized protein n=1 Tax=Rhododendron molle TaxID=49168 RepID=A0ACC0MKZ5_RHOML|nr:hypothetical protein RHMOL_Rhmol08G0048500 [Rhododendron molle]